MSEVFVPARPAVRVCGQRKPDGPRLEAVRGCGCAPPSAPSVDLDFKPYVTPFFLSRDLQHRTSDDISKGFDAEPWVRTCQHFAIGPLRSSRGYANRNIAVEVG